MGKRKNNLFWLSYSDLMTSLFFVMLVLFVLVFSIMQHKASKLEEQSSRLKTQSIKLTAQTKELESQRASLEKNKKSLENEVSKSKRIQKELEDANRILEVKASEFDKINEMRNALENIDSRYFRYNKEFKKHILNVNVRFRTNSFNMLDMDSYTRSKIRDAGKSLENLMRSLPQNGNIKYLLVIEGQASKDGAKINDELSYNRAISLRNFWFGKNPDLNNVLLNCEVIIAGSGQYGVPRELPDIPPANQRFLITIIPKIGEIENE